MASLLNVRVLHRTLVRQHCRRSRARRPARGDWYELALTTGVGLRSGAVTGVHHRRRAVDERLPWDHFDAWGVRGRLLRGGTGAAEDSAVAGALMAIRDVYQRPLRNLGSWMPTAATCAAPACRDYVWLPREQIPFRGMSARRLAGLSVDKIRLTGGDRSCGTISPATDPAGG